MASTKAYETSNQPTTTLFTKWNETELTNHLMRRGLSGDVARNFTEQKITGDHVSANMWDHEGLIRVGIKNEGDRLLCLKFFDELRKSLELHNSKIFQDPIHGPIELHPLLVKIIDTPQFQRLRDIKQLGGVYYVYPGASHNRFEHSIGVCFLAGEFINSLRYRQPELGIDDRDVLCVKIAALCHDMGHGPFSHLYQDLFIKEMRKDLDHQWKHEEASVKLMDHMILVNNDLHHQFQLYDLEWEQDKHFIKELIYGEPVEGAEDFKGREKSKHFLYEIVANKVSGVDVDKMDYLLRDSHGLGITVNFDWKRYIQFARVISDTNGTHICSRDKEVRDVYELLNIRDYLFRAAYQHKTKRAVEFLIFEALKEADELLKIPGKKGNMVKLSEAIDDMEAFTKLTDGVIHAIAFHPGEKLQKARMILAKVQQRQLYKFVGKTLPVNDRPQHSEDDLRIEIVEKYKKEKNEQEDLTFPIPEYSDVKVDFVKFDFGFGNDNPIDKVWFYHKATPDKPVFIRGKKASSFLPSEFEEWEIRIYCKKNDWETSKAVKIGFNEVCKSQGLTVLYEDVDRDSTPPVLQKPNKKDSNGGNRSRPSKISFLRHLINLPNLIPLFITAMLVVAICFSLAGDLESKSLLGVTILQTRKFTVAGGQGVHFDWEDYGIEVSIPSGALPNGFVSTVTIHVSISGPYVFPNPEKWKISSAVYWISSTKNFLLPVMIKIRHSVKGVYNSSKVRFLKATDENINGTFKFTEEPGGHFSASDLHGYISLDHFSGFVICSDMDTDEQFYGRLFWKKVYKMWLYSFLIHREFAKGISGDLLKMYDGWSFMPETSVVFENDEVELILDNTESKWNLAAVYDPLKYIRKQLLQSMEITSNMQFFVWQNNSGTEPLIMSLPLIGTKQPKHILLAVDPDQENTGSLVVTDKIEDEHHLAQWAVYISSSLEYCACLKIEITTCNQIWSDYRGRIKEQVIQISHKWYNSGERTWKEFASAFECMDKPRIARQILEKHSIINDE